MVLLTVPTQGTRSKEKSNILRFLRKGAHTINSGRSKSGEKLSLLRSWFQSSAKSYAQDKTTWEPQDDVLPSFRPELLFTSGAYECSRNAFASGFPVYANFYSCKDFTYYVTRTSLKFDTAEKILQLPLRGNFLRVPSRTLPCRFVDGAVFLNSMSPAIMLGNRDGPISKWYVAFSMHRSYYECNFTAEISISCESRSEKQQFQIGLELHVLDRFGRIYSSRVCHNGFRPVSATKIARFIVPNILNLQTLADRKNHLIQDSKCRFRVIVTYFTGFENDVALSQMVGEVRHVACPRREISNAETVLIQTMNDKLVVNSAYLTPAMLSYLNDGIISLTNFSTKVVVKLIKFNVSGKIQPKLSYLERHEILHLAHKFQYRILKNICLAEMVESLTPENAATVLVEAFAFQAQENLQLQIKQYFILNITSVRNAMATKHLVKRYPSAFVDIVFGPIRQGKMNTGFGFNAHEQQTVVPLGTFLQNAFHSLINNDKRN